MIKATDIISGGSIILYDKHDMKDFLNFLYGSCPKNINPLINRNKPYKNRWLFERIENNN